MDHSGPPGCVDRYPQQTTDASSHKLLTWLQRHPYIIIYTIMRLDLTTVSFSIVTINADVYALSTCLLTYPGNFGPCIIVAVTNGRTCV